MAGGPADPGRGHRGLSWWRGAAARVAFPLPCLVCGDEEPARPVCPACREELLGASGRACGRCAAAIGPWDVARGGCSECAGRSPGFDAAVALGSYQGPLRHLALRLKSRRYAWLAPWLADLLIEARGETLRAYPGASVAAIPLHWRRRWRRGYNQAEALAERLANRLTLPLTRPLRRVLDTRKLAALGRSERAEVMRHAFRARSSADLTGRTVLLVDDILTTGATCGSAARVLKRAGAARVVAVVIGRA